MSPICVGSHTGQQYSSLHRISDLYSRSIVCFDRSLNTLSTHKQTFLALAIIVVMCGDHERSEDKSTPRSLTVGFCVIICPAGVIYW